MQDVFNHSHAYGVTMVQGEKEVDVPAASRDQADSDVEFITLQIQTLRNQGMQEMMGFDLSKEIIIKVYTIRTYKVYEQAFKSKS